LGEGQLRTAKHLGFMTILLFALSWWGVSSLAFFNSDTGLRFWQIRELVANNWQTFAISYPQHGLDPELEFIPLYCAYSVLNDNVYLNITYFLPLFVSFFYAWLGIGGLAIVPTLSGLATVLAIYKLAQLVELRRLYLILWSAILATPLLFYSIQLWDHGLAMACASWGVYGIAVGIQQQRWQPVAIAGLLTALGLGQRPEMYMMALALGLVLMVITWPRVRLTLAFIIGGVVGVLPIWWLQYQWIGHPLGILMTHVSGYGRPESFVFSCGGQARSVQIGSFLLYIDARDIWSIVATILVISGLFLLLFWLRLPVLQTNTVVYIALISVTIGYSLWGWRLWHYTLVGLITTFPLIGLSLAYVDKQEDSSDHYSIYQFVFWSAIVFIIGMIAIWPAYGGKHFGARYLLPVYPLLLFLAFYAYSAYASKEGLRKPMEVVSATLLLLTIVLQLFGMRVFIRQTTENTQIQATIASLPAQIILTNHPFLPTMLYGLEEQSFMYVRTEADLEELIIRFIEQEISEFVFLGVDGLSLQVPTQIDGVKIQEISAGGEKWMPRLLWPSFYTIVPLP
jgi:hypothetical protein